MKRKILTVCLIVIFALTIVCVSACSNTVADDLRTINSLLRKDYSSTEIHVSTEKDGLTLEANYSLTKRGNFTDIEYTVDRLNGFDVNGSSVTAPNEFKTSFSGSATYDGDRITSIDGNQEMQDVLLDIAETTMILRVSYFQKVDRTKTSFKAKVVNPQELLGDEEFDGDDMSIEIKYGKTSVDSIVIDYVDASGASVKVTYEFAL